MNDNDLEVTQNKNGVFQYLKIGSIAGVISVIAAISVNAFDIGSFIYDSGQKSGATSATVSSELKNLTDRTSRLEQDTNQTTKNNRAIEKLEDALDELKNSSSDINVKRITTQNKLLEDKIKQLEAMIENLPTSSNAGISKEALVSAVEQAVQKSEIRLTSNIETLVAQTIEKRLADLNILSTSNGNVPIATKRTIHSVEKECVYLPSLGKSFTIKMAKNSELCLNPSQLYARITRISDNSNGIEFYIPTYGEYRCSTNTQRNNKCKIGTSNTKNSYIVYTEKIYEELGKIYGELRFQEVPQ